MSAPVRILVVHEEPTMVLMLRRTLDASRRWEVTGARTCAAALDRLAVEPFRVVLLSWDLPENGALNLMAGLEERLPARRPWVLAMQAGWSQEDLARGVQTGVDGFVGSPLTPDALATEVDGLSTCGEAPTRTRVLSLAGSRLTREDERLWSSVDDPAWRERMIHLARGLRRKAEARVVDASDRLVLRLDEISERPPGPEALRALRAQLERPGASAEDIALHIGQDPGKVGAWLGALKELFGTGGGRHPFRSDAREAVERAAKVLGARPEDKPVSPAGLQRLKGLAADLLGGNLSAAGAAQARGELDRSIADLMRAPVASVAALKPPAAQYVAAGLLASPEPALAIDRGRLAVLQEILTAIEAGEPVDQTRLRALAAAFGVVPPVDPAVVPRLVSLAASLWPEPGIEEVDTARLAALEAVLKYVEAPADVDMAALRSRLAQLRAAADPGAQVDLQRVSRLVDACEQSDLLRVGIATVGAIVRSMDRGRPDPILLRLYKLVGARDKAAVQRLFEAAVALRAVRPVPVLDNRRLIEVFQRALAETAAIDSPRMAALVRAVDLSQSMERVAVGLPPDPPAPPTEAVRVGAYLQALARNLDEPLESLSLDAPQVERLAAQLERPEPGPGAALGLAPEVSLRLRVLVAVLGRAGKDRTAILQKVLAGEGKDVRVLLTLSAMLSEEGHREALEQMRVMLGLNARTSTARDVEGHLANGRLQAAVLGLADLADTEPRLLGFLNEAALALRNLGRGPEGEPLFKRALRIAPERLNLLFNYGRMLHESGRHAEAIDVAQRVKGLAPDFAMADSLLRDATAGLGRLPAAA